MSFECKYLINESEKSSPVWASLTRERQAFINADAIERWGQDYLISPAQSNSLLETINDMNDEVSSRLKRPWISITTLTDVLGEDLTDGGILARWLYFLNRQVRDQSLDEQWGEVAIIVSRLFHLSSWWGLQTRPMFW